MTRSSSVNKTTMKNILNDGRDISIAKLVEILVLLLNNLVILPVEDRIKFILHGESTLLILLIMELEEK